MAERKRKGRENTNMVTKAKGEKKRKTFNSSNKKKNNKRSKDERRGPRLPSSLRREVDSINPRNISDDDDSIDVDELHDAYEYDEPMPEEESKKNRRFDPVDNLEYELPEEFEDENVSSDDDDGNNVDHDNESKSRRHDFENDDSEDDDEEEKNGRHTRMLQGITGMPAEAFEGKKRKFAVVSEAYPESEYNPTRAVLEGDGRVSIQDLLEPLQKKRGYSDLRKRMEKLATESMSVQAPLSKVERDYLERKAAYGETTKQITKSESQVKKNREAPTLFFGGKTDLGNSTVGAMAAKFKPTTKFEKEMYSLVHDANVVEAHMEDGARLLELNMISVEDVKDRQNRLAKMRSYLFCHEMKAKRIKKIKSKTYHSLLKKNKLKAAYTGMHTDPEAAKEQAMKQEFERAQERMTLKHKNSSKWAKRILERGLNAQNEVTRVAITEQLHRHTELTRKMNSMKDSSSSEESSGEDDDGDNDNDDELCVGTEQDRASKLLTNAKKKTIKVMEEEDEMPTSGVLSLPFMLRGLKKRKEEADAEAKLALEELDSSLKQLEDTNGSGNPKGGISAGRRVFGTARKDSEKSESRIKSNIIDRDSDSEDEYMARNNVDVERAENGVSQEEVNVDINMLRQESGIGCQSVFKSFGDTVRDPGPKTAFEVAIFTSNSFKKMGSKNVTNRDVKESPLLVEPPLPHQNLKGVDKDGDTESEEEMVDGILSSGTKPEYELPSQEDIIHRAFATDDVEGEFEKEKLEVLNEENPEPEKPLLLPGWGQWTHNQQQRGMPSWMLKEHESAKKEREYRLKKRKDADLKHVIISEKPNKKAEKLHPKSLPHPFTSKEVFEQSIRVPIGPDFNPITSVAALTRPEVVKKPGVIIGPIKYEEVNPYDRENEHKSKGQNQKSKNKSKSRKANKMTKTN